MSRRTKSRQVALQMLFQIDMNPDVDAHTVRDMIAEQLHDEQLEHFAWRLFTGVREQRAQIDEQITAIAANWSLARMAPTDRNLLRLGAFELQHWDTPHQVVIDEMVELARKFGTAQSSQFVNGLLDKLVPESKRTLPPYRPGKNSAEKTDDSVEPDTGADTGLE